MAQQILLPKLGLTMEEGTILEWVVVAGDEVSVGDVILRLATDKVDVDVEAEHAGRFEPVVAVGVSLPPGSLLGWLLAADEQAPSTTGPAVSAAPTPEAGPAPASAAPDVAPATRQKVSPNARRVAREQHLDLTGLTGTGPGGRILSEDVEDAVARRAAQVGQVGQVGQVASPLVRRHAQQLGVDVSALSGTGSGGRIRRTDVEQAAPQTTGRAGTAGTAGTARTAGRPGPVAGQVIPLSGLRGAIARNVHASLQEMAQLTHGFEADVTGLVALRTQIKREWASSALRVPTINDFVVRATALALVEHPLLNATVLEDGIHLLEDIHLGIAVAVPGGLMVPVVRDAHRCGLRSIGEQTLALAGAAREGRLGAGELADATFVVSSLGAYGVDFFTPVVNRGNVGILGVGRVRDSVRWAGEVPERTQVLTLSLSFDHRAVDGAPAAEFLRTVADLLGRPTVLLAA